MRQLKTFMKNRREEMLSCGPCECRTLQYWRYANENCGCGDSATFMVGNKVYVELIDTETGVSVVKYFTTGKNGKDYILVQSGVELIGAFDSAGGQALEEIIFDGNYSELFLIGKGWVMPTTGAVGTIDADAMTLVTKVFEDPSEENKQELRSFLQTHIEAVQQGDTNAVLVTYPVESSITFFSDSGWEVGTLGQKTFGAIVNPDDESITAVSSDPSILRVDSVEKDTTVPLNVYRITCTGVAVGTATITATCVNDPSVSASTPTITVNP